jgi:hypothetical protein
MSYGPLNTATMGSRQIALSVEQLAAIAERAATGEEPATAEALLADARFLAHEAEVLDTQRRVLRASSDALLVADLALQHGSDKGLRLASGVGRHPRAPPAAEGGRDIGGVVAASGVDGMPG